MGTPTPADVAPRPALRASRLEAWDHCPRADRVEDVGRLPRPLADPRPRLLGEGAHGLSLDRLARAMAQRLTRFIPPTLARHLGRQAARKEDAAW